MLIFRGVVPEISQLFLYKSLFAPAASLGASTTAEDHVTILPDKALFQKKHMTRYPVGPWKIEKDNTRWNLFKLDWLVFSTHLKNISQIGSLPPQVGVKIKNIWNHPVNI